MSKNNYNRRKFFGISASVISMSLAGCTALNEEEQLEFDIKEDINDWDETNNYEFKSTENGEIKLDAKLNNNTLSIYASAVAPQSNYKLTVDSVNYNGSDITLDAYVESTGSDVGLTVITDVDTIVEINLPESTIDEINLKIEDGWNESHQIKTIFD